MRHAFRLVASIAFSALLSGCALVTSTVDIQYQSSTKVAPVLGAAGTRVNVVVNDARKGRPDQISVKKNGYGMEMAAILASRPIPDIIRDAVSTELQKMGFQLGVGDVTALIEVNKLTNDFKLGFFSGDAVAEVILAAQVRSASGRIDYAKSVSGDNVLPGIMLAEGHNAKASLEPALSSAVANLVSDPSFLRALLLTRGGRPEA